MSLETDLQLLTDSVNAAAEVASKLSAENKELRKSLRAINDFKTEPSFGELNFVDREEWDSKKLSELRQVIKREAWKHKIW